MKSIFALFLVVACAAQAGQAVSVQPRPFEGRNERGEAVGDAVKMPHITLPDRRVAARINDMLSITLLGALGPKDAGKARGAEAVVLPGAFSQEYTIARNDGRILSFVFEQEGCGAYCEIYHSYSSFDVKTGRMLDDADLFTERGQAALERRMQGERIGRYRGMLASLQKDLKRLRKNRRRSVEAGDDLQGRIDLNSRCAGGGDDPEPVSGKFNVQLAYKTVNLIAERCGNHAQRALDDVGEVWISITYENLRPHLTPYGKALLLGEGDARQDSLFGQLLRGKLGGTIGVTVLLAKDEGNAVGGTLFYDKVGQPITLTGTLDGDALVLAEAAPDGEAAPLWRLRMEANRLHGKWVGKRELRAELAP
ncbi:hypothetical protein [Massilia glaciei]|uniref:Uncharacterized protein n=1 Tax=Massilia glaciei TaxID=1524097 RepID=A0A2U2I6X2_9BURK|nr:hypothetical protein [Massilia glaciei]PWF55518.1 hypothetical protein C7C56_001500 [Massilia glaciei]